MINKFFLNLCL